MQALSTPARLCFVVYQRACLYCDPRDWLRHASQTVRIRQCPNGATLGRHVPDELPARDGT